MGLRKQRTNWFLAAISISVVAAIVTNVRELSSTTANETGTLSIIDASKYASLHDAIDALPDAGGIVNIPPGTYTISKTIWLTRDNTRIQGAGPSTHIVNANEKGEHALTLEHKDRPNEPLARLTRVEVADLRISGNPKSGDGIFVEGVKGLYLEGLTVDHHGEHGMRILDSFDGPRVVGCNVHENGFDGLYSLVSHDLTISANQFWKNRDGVSMHDSTNLSICGNNLRSQRRDGLVLDRVSFASVSGNALRGCKGRGIALRAAKDIVVSGNALVEVRGAGVKAGKDCLRILVGDNGFFNGADKLESAVKTIDLDGATGSIIGTNLAQ